MSACKEKREVGFMLASRRKAMGLTNAAFERKNGFANAMSYNFERGECLFGKHMEKIKTAYQLSPEQCEMIDLLKQDKAAFRQILLACHHYGIPLIYLKVTSDKFELPLCEGERMIDLAKAEGVDLTAVSKGISRYLSGRKSRYAVVPEPLCEDDALEEQRLKAFYEGDVMECLRLTKRAERLAKIKGEAKEA